MVLALLDHGYPIPGDGKKQKIIEGFLHFPAISNNIYFYMMLQTIPAITKAVTTWRIAVSSWTRNRPYQVSEKVLLDWRFFRKETGFVGWQNRFL